MDRVHTAMQGLADSGLASGYEIDRLLARLGAMPRILCWSCRKLTPFDSDYCEHCGAAFAGGTGGAYGASPVASSPRSYVSRTSSRRTIQEISRDIERLGQIDVSMSRRSGDDVESFTRYQCPSCGRFVSKHATECACGARFAPGQETFLCPECVSRVPAEADMCPVCRVSFEPGDLRAEGAYACPRCGVLVTVDAVRCACGAWFED